MSSRNLSRWRPNNSISYEVASPRILITKRSVRNRPWSHGGLLVSYAPFHWFKLAIISNKREKNLNDHLLVSNLRQRITLWFSFLPDSLPEGYFIKKMDLELDSIFTPKESH